MESITSVKCMVIFYSKMGMHTENVHSWLSMCSYYVENSISSVVECAIPIIASVIKCA